MPTNRATIVNNYSLEAIGLINNLFIILLIFLKDKGRAFEVACYQIAYEKK